MPDIFGFEWVTWGYITAVFGLVLLVEVVITQYIRERRYTDKLIESSRWAPSIGEFIAIMCAYALSGILGRMVGNIQGAVIWCSIIIGVIYAYRRRKDKSREWTDADKEEFKRRMDAQRQSRH